MIRCDECGELYKQGTVHECAKPPVPIKGDWNVVIVYESQDTDTMPEGQVKQITSLVFRDRLTHIGYKLGLFDQDAVGPNDQPTAELVGFIEAAKQGTLPQLVVEKDGKYLAYPLPATMDETVKLLEGL
jgi:hypothetical protein